VLHVVLACIRKIPIVIMAGKEEEEEGGGLAFVRELACIVFKCASNTHPIAEIDDDDNVRMRVVTTRVMMPIARQCWCWQCVGGVLSGGGDRREAW
jgi:hypothetical protein